MAKDKRLQNSLARLTPESKVIVVDGQELRIPGNAQENSVMSKVMASQIREVVQTTLKNYREDGLKFTPKELRDIAEAGKAVTELCGTVFQDETPNPMKRVHMDEEPHSVVDFSGISKVPEIAINPNADKPSSPNPQPAGVG